ncbi:MAG: hypothetical protein ABSA83_15310 [Verrucomicrobiota bacterium]|jgi:hypothetical protein
MKNFAKRLIAHEARGYKSDQTKAAAAFRVCEKLHRPLAALMGNGGFRTLLSRSLVLATMEVPWLGAVRVKGDGSLEGTEDVPSQSGPDKGLEGGVVLLAQLLGLLMALIGEVLTLRLVGELYPKAWVNVLDLVNGDKNEKTK